MLQYGCPEKQKLALRGHNLPRDIRAAVRQGIGLGEMTPVSYRPTGVSPHGLKQRMGIKSEIQPMTRRTGPIRHVSSAVGG